MSDAAGRAGRRLPRRGVHHAPGALRALLWGTAAPGGRRASFERGLAARCGVTHAVATGSGRAAQAMLLQALIDLGRVLPGDRVVLPALTFHAVPAAVEQVGLEVVFADVDPDDLLMGPDQLRAALAQAPPGRRCRLVLATHLMGVPADVSGLAAVCREHDLLLVEDLAQAVGASTPTGPVGSVGLAGFTSLETVKPLNAFGGGAVLTGDHDLAAALRRAAHRLPPPDASRLARKVVLGHVEAVLARPLPFSLLGWPLQAGSAGGSEGLVARYKERKRGAGNHGAALSPGQAAAGLACLDNLDRHLAERVTLAEALQDRLPPEAWRVVLRPGSQAIWYQVVVRATDVDALVAAGRRAGLDLGRDVLTDLSRGACALAAEAAASAVQLPCHPGLSEADLDRVAATVAPWLA